MALQRGDITVLGDRRTGNALVIAIAPHTGAAYQAPEPHPNYTLFKPSNRMRSLLLFI